jgi:hypothetical protein
MGSRGFPYAGGGPHFRGFPYSRLGEFLIDSVMRNSCYTIASKRKRKTIENICCNLRAL